MITRITVFSTVILITSLNAVYMCTTTEEKYARSGETVTLQFQAVTTNPKNPVLLATNIVETPNNTLFTLIYINGSRTKEDPTCNGCTFAGDISTGDISVMIDILQTTNAGTYKHILQSPQKDIKCITVYILGVPEKPTITSDNNNIVGFDTKLTCSSKSTTQPIYSNLKLQYTWTIDNQDENRYVYSQNKNTLTIKHLMKTDFHNRLTCKATESGNGIVGETSLSSTVFVLVFIYGPDTGTTTLNPANLLYIKEDGDSLNDITCNGDCYPSCTYRWTRSDSSWIVNSHTLSLAQLSRAENANYTCTVTNANRKEMTITNTVTVIVRYGPDTNTTVLSPSYSSYIKNEGEPLNQVTCSGICVPSCGYKWTKLGATGAVIVSSTQVLSLGLLNRSEAAIYTCTVSNPKTGQKQTKQITVTVIYGPDFLTTTLSPPTTVYTLAEGTLLPNITCVGDCFPACSYKWTKPGNKEVARGSILSLGTLTREISTVYTCEVTNTQKGVFVAKTVMINVMYISFFVNRSEGENEITVDEYIDVHFTCLITSESESTVRIMFQDDTLKEQLQTKSLTFTRNSITCLHAGSYTCEGNNQHGKVSSAPIKLLVRCSPRPLRHAKTNFTSLLYGSVTLSFTTLAYPEPGSSGYLWHKEDGIRWIPLLSNTDLLISSSGLNSNLTIMNVSLQDYGQYRVTVTNDIGSYEHYLFLVEEGEQNQHITKDNCAEERDKTGLIVGISFGIFTAILSVYSTFVTIALKRKTTNTGTKLMEESTKQTTYINVAEGRDNIGSGDNSLEMYTDLAGSAVDDKTTYDIIQRI